MPSWRRWYALTLITGCLGATLSTSVVTEVMAGSPPGDEWVPSPEKQHANKLTQGEIGPGDKVRCHLVVDNWTPWKVGVSVNEDYMALIPPWGKVEATSATSGRKKVEAEAKVKDTTYSWVEEFDCKRNHVWKVRQDEARATRVGEQR